MRETLEIVTGVDTLSKFESESPALEEDKCCRSSCRTHNTTSCVSSE